MGKRLRVGVLRENKKSVSWSLSIEGKQQEAQNSFIALLLFFVVPAGIMKNSSIVNRGQKPI